MIAGYELFGRYRDDEISLRFDVSTHALKVEPHCARVNASRRNSDAFFSSLLVSDLSRPSLNPVQSGALVFAFIQAARLVAHWLPWFTPYWQWSGPFLTGIWIPNLHVTFGLDILIGLACTFALAWQTTKRHPPRALLPPILLAVSVFLVLFFAAIYLPTLFFLGRLGLSPPNLNEPFSAGTIFMLALALVLVFFFRTRASQRFT